MESAIQCLGFDRYDPLSIRRARCHPDADRIPSAARPMSVIGIVGFKADLRLQTVRAEGASTTRPRRFLRCGQAQPLLGTSSL